MTRFNFSGTKTKPTLFDSVNIGGVWYPSLPPSVPGADGVPSGWSGRGGPMYSGTRPKPQTVVKLPLGGNSGSYNHGPKVGPNMRPPTLKDMLKGGAFGRLDGLINIGEMLWSVGNMIQPAPYNHAETPGDGTGFFANLPPGWIQCYRNNRWIPGNTGTNGLYTFYGVGNMSAGLDPSSAACQTYGTNANFRGGIGASQNYWYTGVYSRLFRNGQQTGNILPGLIVRTTSKTYPKPSEVDGPQFYITPSPDIKPAIEAPVPYVQPYNPLLASLMPGTAPVTGTGTPGFLPWVVLPKRRPGVSPQDWTGTYTPPAPVAPPVPPVPPVGPYVPLPSRPPRGTLERKRYMAPKDVIRLKNAGKELVDFATESCEAVGTVWDTLPHSVKWTAGVSKGCAEKTKDVLSNLDKIDWSAAIMGLLQNYYEDKAWGQYHSLLDKAGKGLGQPGWKFDQPLSFR